MIPINPLPRLWKLAQGAAFVTGLGLSILFLFGSTNPELPPLKVNVGEKAPDFALASADGKSVKLSDFAGHNVLIDFYRGYW